MNDELEPQVVVRGQTWFLFGADYQLDTGPMSFYFYALSPEHAEISMQAIRSTGKVYGQIMEVIDAGDDLRAPITTN